MLRMTTWGNSRTWPFGRYTGRFSYLTLLTLPRERNGPRRKWAQSFLGCAADQAPRCSPMSAPIWAPQRTERAMFPNEGGASVRTWLTPSSPRNTNFVLHSKNSPQQRQVTRPFSSLLWASPWSLQCSHRDQNGHMESATQRLEQQEIREGFQCFLQLLNDCNSSRWPSITAPQASGWCPEAAWC